MPTEKHRVVLHLLSINMGLKKGLNRSMNIEYNLERKNKDYRESFTNTV